MPAFHSNELIKNIKLDQLSIKKGEISGDLISGGTVQNFSSTGIKDSSTELSLIVENGSISVDKIKTKEISNDLIIKGNLHVLEHLTVKKMHVEEFVSERTFDKMYLEFQPVDTGKNPNGSGLIWKGADYTKLFVLKNNKDRFFSSENIDLQNDKSYQIDGVDVLSKNSLGSGIRKSNLREVGSLHSLTVTGDVDLAEFVSIDSNSQRIAINIDKAVGTLTIGDLMNDVIFNIDLDNGRAKIGTYNNRPLDLTCGDMSLITLDPKGAIHFGNEYKSDVSCKVWGKLGVNIKNPEADIDVKNSIKFGGKLFTVDNSPPKVGNYKRGDIVWNEAPTTNSPIGWVCIVTGSPGVWAQFGLVQE
jgi:hypothetical protein